jgi:purine-cytosine permease-like protein
VSESTRLSSIERHSIDYVPAAERHGSVRAQAPFWFLGNTQFLLVAVGFIGPGMGLSLRYTLLATVIGILFGTIFMAFHASQGPDLGLPQMVQSRAQFGFRGVIVPLFGALVMFLAYNVVDTLLLRQGLHGVFGWNPAAVAWGSAAIALVLAIWGYDWLMLIFQVLFWISLPLLLIVTAAILLGHTAWPPAAPAASGAPVQLGWNLAAFATQLATAAATNITWAPCVSDYTRYLPRRTPTGAIIFNVFLGAAGAGIWLIGLGAWLAATLNTSDALVGLRAAGDAVFPYLGAAVSLATVAALVATMAVNIYSGMLTIVTALDSVRPTPRTQAVRIGFILLFTAVWLVIALPLQAGAIDALSNALPIMLYLLVPWTAVNLVDFFLVRRGHYAVTDMFTPQGVYGAWGARGLIAYGVGFACSVPFFVLTGIFVGPLAQRLAGVDIAWLVGLAVSGGLYWLLSRSFDPARERAAIAGSDARLAALDAASPAE